MESDINPVEVKRVEEIDGSSAMVSDEPLKDGESQGCFDGGSRVLDTKRITCGGSVDGGEGDGDDFNVNMPLKELSIRKNLRDQKTGGKEDSFDGSGFKKLLKETEFGERNDQNGSGGLTGEDGLSQKPERGDGGNDDGTKAVGDYGREEEHLKSRGRRGRKSKVESGDGRDSNMKVVDSDKKVAEVLGSISQRTRNRVVKGKKEEIKDRDVEQSDGDGHESAFCMGDFVWGKIKSHPWWPGRIYDPSNASDLALKYKHEGRLLVAYFGDGTFAWCDPSQLKPFEDNFEEMSKQSSLKNFVNAVEESVDEFCCLVELRMTLASAKEEGQSSLPLVVNAGIKEGVHVPLDGVAKSSVVHFEPAKILAEIRRFAITISVTNMLELRVIKSCLSGFYHAKGGYSLPAYHEPLGIEELVGIETAMGDGLAPGPDEEDWSVSPGDLSVAQTGPETPDGSKSRKRRKEKSIAELLGMDAKVELEVNHTGSIKEEMQSGKMESKSGKKKQKFINEDQGDGDEWNHDDKTEINKEDGQLGKVESKSGRKKRKLGENQNHAVENSVTTRSRTRKKEEPAGATTIEKKPSSDEEDGRARKDQRRMKSLPKDRKISISIGLENGLVAEEIQERISPREKKRSKYLSPPYTSPLQKQRTLGSPGGPLEFSDVARMGERMSKAAGKLVGSPPIVKCSAETFQKSSKGLTSAHEKSHHANNPTSKMDLSPKVDGSIKDIGSSDEVLSEMRSAALDPLTPRKDHSFDTIKGFLSSYRSANYKDGSDYNLYKKHMAGQKKRKQNSHGSDMKLRNQVARDTSEPKTPRSATKKKERKSDLKAESELANGSVSSAALLITFPQEFALPTKEALLKMHSRFGHLDELKTEVIPKSSSAKIVFFKSSDAEAAMHGMHKSSPFGSAKVSYQIQRLTAAGSKAKRVNAQNKKKSKLSETQESKSSEQNPPAAPDNEPLAVIFIKQKLEAMNSMLAQTDGKMSDETKSNLESEVEQLLKKVKMMTGSSSASPS